MAKPLKKLCKKILKSSFASWLAGWIIYIYVKFIKATTKWKIEGLDDALKMLEEGKNAILLIWHGRIPMVASFWPRKYTLKALVSLHQDGRLIAGFLKHAGIDTIGGSSSTNAKGSALHLMKTLKNGAPIAIIPDGPRGPRQRMTHSPVYFAQKTGTPIICMTYSVAGSKIMEKSWDKMMLPKPFSKGTILISEPVFIPEETHKNELEKYRKMIEDKMNDMQNTADDYTNMPHILPNDEIKKKRS